MALLRLNQSGPGGRGSIIRTGLVLAGLALSSLFAPEAPAATPVVREYQIEAIFLFNFAQFVDWPPEAFSGPGDPLVIGILGNDPFGAYMDEAVRGERVNDRPIVIRRFARVEDITTCHILFISRSESARLDQILGRLKGRSILTVSDIDDFNQSRGMIRFVIEKNKIRLRINLGAAKSAGLKISSKLLRPAQIVSRR